MARRVMSSNTRSLRTSFFVLSWSKRNRRLRNSGEKGTNRSRFFRGQVDKYSWVDVGSSYLPSELISALLLAQLEESDKIQTRRHGIWTEYDERLRDWAAANDVGTPVVPEGCEHPAHMYYLIMPNMERRTAFIGFLRSRGVLAVFHYLPLHLSEYASRYGGAKGDCPIAESTSDRLVRLPLFYDMTDDQVEHVVSAVLSFEVS